MTTNGGRREENAEMTTRSGGTSGNNCPETKFGQINARVPGVVRDIQTISGGFAGGGESNSARKAHAIKIHKLSRNNVSA